ncbi:hypothetical protein [Natrinema pallidum]|uniref:Uncharacterized protein n=2 Tax=Natrinema pallidum TaxID=69527 RepID=L9YPW7_9EURY|nr:hypothetical protein [Natrinema pallidum]ELY76159.1 hypothetical protein C487_11871 [Natrinema pallidum DSM 3751]QCW03147.1 hypothetical protein FGF80_07810 [Natrinema pallidum]
MDRALPIAVGIGIGVGTAASLLADATWGVCLGVSALYTGWSYFAVRTPDLLSLEGLTFERTPDRIGYAIGLVGASLFGATVFDTDGLGVVPFVGYLGVIGFLLTASAACDRRDGRRSP